MPSDSAPASDQSNQAEMKQIKVENPDQKSLGNNPDTKDSKINPWKRPADVKNDTKDFSSSEFKQVAKKPKLGLPGIPNFKKMNQPESVRYSDYYLVEMKNSCDSIIKTRVSKLITMPMYSFSANVLCKYMDQDKAKFVPLEITICAHSIKEGRIGQPYHVMIDPGDIPLRCYNISKDHSEATHKITVGAGKWPEEARNDYKTIYKEILSYTKAGERTILIGDVHDLDQVKGTIEWLYEKAIAENPAASLAKPSTWTVLPVVEYVVAMYNHVHMKMLGNDSAKFVLPYYLRMQLECSFLDYNPALMCPYHSKDEYQTKWCTLSCAQRMFHVIEPTLEAIEADYRRATSIPRPTHTQPPNSSDLSRQSQPPNPLTVQGPKEIGPQTAPAPLPIEGPTKTNVNSMDPRLRRSQPDTQ